MVTPDSSANLGSSVAVIYDDAKNFTNGDVVEITYSGAITESSGTKSITADTITKASDASSGSDSDDSVNLLDETPAVVETEAKVTEEPVITNVSTESTSAKTGNAPITAAASVAVITGAAICANTMLKKRG